MSLHFQKKSGQKGTNKQNFTETSKWFIIWEQNWFKN